MMKTLSLFSYILSIFCFSMVFPLHGGTASIADDKTPSFATITRNCMACHGYQGRTDSAMPSIANLPYDELRNILQEYRDNKRDATIMNRLMQAFSDEDIHKLAEYFSSIPPE